MLAGVTILLALTVFSLMVSETLPETSEAVPLIGQPAGALSHALLPASRGLVTRADQRRARLFSNGPTPSFRILCTLSGTAVTGEACVMARQPSLAVFALFAPPPLSQQPLTWKLARAACLRALLQRCNTGLGMLSRRPSSG